MSSRERDTDVDRIHDTIQATAPRSAGLLKVATLSVDRDIADWLAD